MLTCRSLVSRALISAAALIGTATALPTSARAAVPTWEELEQPFSARLNEIANYPEADTAQHELRDPRCRNGVACSGDLRVQGEFGVGGDLLALGPTSGLQLTGRYRWFQVGLGYEHVNDFWHRGETNSFSGQAGLAWQSSFGLRLEAGLVLGYSTTRVKQDDQFEDANRLFTGARGAIAYEFATSSTNHLLVGLAVTGGSNVLPSAPASILDEALTPRGSAMLTLGYALDL
ncbi:MAG: hypothetical protein R3B07_11250 [Polyangiaceae bacterium]